ncbi:MAG: DNA polymerase III subunit chi [Deltaproteobacteria bacterium]|nr:DNA polymerase III subunit chi [Deltaproteobacteria bacterium]
MPKVVFVKVPAPPLEEAVCQSVQALVEKGLKVQLHVEAGEPAKALDNLLWTFSQGAFIAHRLVSPEETPAGDPEQALLISSLIVWPKADALVLSSPAEIEHCMKFDLVVDFAPTFSPSLVEAARERFKSWRAKDFEPVFFEGIGWLSNKL